MEDSSCEKRYALDVVQSTSFPDKEPTDCVRVVAIVYVLWLMHVVIVREDHSRVGQPDGGEEA